MASKLFSKLFDHYADLIGKKITVNGITGELIAVTEYDGVKSCKIGTWVSLRVSGAEVEIEVTK